jgi:hypothetical protein
MTLKPVNPTAELDLKLCAWEFEQGRVKAAPNDDPAGRSYGVGELAGSWQIIFIGKCWGENTVIFEKNDVSSGAYYYVQEGGKSGEIAKPDFAALGKKPDESDLYLGLQLEEILNSGEDLLAQKILSKGEPAMEDVADVLPPLTKRQYAVIGSQASWGKVIVMPNGNIVPQETGNDLRPAPIFSPVELDYRLGSETPVQGLLQNWMPMLLSQHNVDAKILEIVHFVEAGDPDRDPLVWIRAIWWNEGTPGIQREEIFQVSRSRPIRKTQIDPGLFWDAFITTAASWDATSAATTRFELPEKELSDSVKGTLAALSTTFSGDHPHYGYRDYARELHDHFPPTFLTAIEVFSAFGMGLKARRIAEHILAYVVDSAGRFTYRQGAKEEYATSGTEYGQWLWLLERLETGMPPKGWIASYLDKLADTGKFLIHSRVETPEAGGRNLVLLCAEADNNNRLFAYAGNNLWAVRGLQALGKLLRRYGRVQEADYFEQQADDLLAELRAALDDAKQESRFGPLVPFQFGYAVEPWTLSACKLRPEGLDENTFNEYISRFGLRDDIQGEQDLSENTFANYRYYLEMLSPMLLESSEAQAIMNMRRQLGGELLGMTRFFSWVDDWPASHYARYLLATDQIDAFLLLLYAHHKHHGVPHLHIYFEQVTVDGKVMAHDCVPNLILVPTMINWMFCFEPPGSDDLYLLRAIPQKWFGEPCSFGAEQLGSTLGSLDIRVEVEQSGIRLSANLPEDAAAKKIHIDLRTSEELKLDRITDGKEIVEAIKPGNRLILNKGTSGKISLFIER